MEVAVADNRNLAESLQTIGRDVRAALDVAVTVPEGAAADATQADLSTWQSPGETGWAQAESAALAVEDQATHHVQARNDVHALPDATLFEDAGRLSPEHGRRHNAIAAANLYQGNSNHSLGAGGPALGAAPGPAGTSPSPGSGSAAPPSRVGEQGVAVDSPAAGGSRPSGLGSSSPTRRPGVADTFSTRLPPVTDPVIGNRHRPEWGRSPGPGGTGTGAVGGGRPDAAAPGSGGRTRAAPPVTSPVGSTGSAAGPRGTAASMHGGMPLMGASTGGGGQDDEHRRPSRLLEDDPQAFWFRDQAQPGQGDQVTPPGS